MDPRLSHRGFFGKGIYFSASFQKANDYAGKHEFNNLRCMFLCHVILGKSKVYAAGDFDRDLVMEPIGFDSVEGIISRDKEFVVYNGNRVYVSHMIFYKWKASAVEQPVPLFVSAHLNLGNYYVPPQLINWFKKIMGTCTTNQMLIEVKVILRQLVEKKQPMMEVLSRLEKAMKKSTTIEHKEHLKMLLDQVKENPPPSASSSAFTFSAPLPPPPPIPPLTNVFLLSNPSVPAPPLPAPAFFLIPPPSPPPSLPFQSTPPSSPPPSA